MFSFRNESISWSRVAVQKLTFNTEVEQKAIIFYFTTQVSADPAGRSAQPDHLRDSTSRKRDNSSPSANRILSTALLVMAIMAVRADSWIMPSGTSKLMVESTPKLVTRMRRETTTADIIQTTLELQTRVRGVKKLSAGFVCGTAFKNAGNSCSCQGLPG